ncbi:Rac/Rho-like_protein [Hexamita inflata]|uniref:Rac/Rho-like protein n=1 Tax=Hexamita inflata TaxID=28002 RepID=A0AA86VRG5_9EUKA|nr:Rac/Rho-like protein [Hexamita inflata]
MKCVIVGDNQVGKTCLSTVICEKQFPQEYIPTVFDNYTLNYTYNRKELNISIIDTYDFGARVLRPLGNINASIFLLCYAVDNLDSLNNIQTKWLEIVHQQSSNAHLIIVGTKSDLTNTTYQQAQQLADKLHAKHILCSALQSNNIQLLLSEIAQNVVQK